MILNQQFRAIFWHIFARFFGFRFYPTLMELLFVNRHRGITERKLLSKITIPILGVISSSSLN